MKIKNAWSVLWNKKVAISKEKKHEIEILNQLGIGFCDAQYDIKIFDVLSTSRKNPELHEMTSFLDSVPHDVYPTFIRFYFEAHRDRFEFLKNEYDRVKSPKKDKN